MILSSSTNITTNSQILSGLNGWHLVLGDGIEGPFHAIRHRDTLTAGGATVESEQLVKDSRGLPLIHRIKNPGSCNKRVALILGGGWVGNAYAVSVNAILKIAHEGNIPTILINAPDRLPGVQGNFTRIHNPRNIRLELAQILSKR